MASFVKFEQFVKDVADKAHDFDAAADVLKLMLTNTAPVAATDAVLSDITEIGTGNGYTAGGEDALNTISESGGVMTCDGTNVVWNASGGDIGPWRYAVLYNDSQTSPVKPLIGYWDNGSSDTITDGGSLTLNITTDLFTFT